MKIGKLVLLVSVLSAVFFAFTGLAAADIFFEDTAERVAGDPTVYWNTTKDTGVNEVCSIVQYPSTVQSSHSMYIYTHTPTSSSASEYYVESNAPAFDGYYSLVSRKFQFYSSKDSAEASPSGKAYLYIVNDSGTAVAQATLFSLNRYSIGSDTDIHTFEIYDSGNEIYMKKDGGEASLVGLYNDVNPPYYVRVSVYAKVYYDYYSGYPYGYTKFYFDDSGTGSVVGLNSEWSELNDDIEASYKVAGFDTYNGTYTHYLKMYKTSTGELVNTTVLTDRAGFMIYDRSEVLGENYGMYKLKIYRGSTELTSKAFYYGQSLEGGAYTDVEIPVTPSVDAIIYDGDGNGGSVEAGGTVWLTPQETVDGVYDVTVSLNTSTTPDSFEVVTDADADYVNGLDVTFSNLAQQYQVNYNDVMQGVTIGTSSTYSTATLGGTWTLSTYAGGGGGGGSGGGEDYILTIDEVKALEAQALAMSDEGGEGDNANFTIFNLWWIGLIGGLGICWNEGRKKDWKRSDFLFLFGLVLALVSVYKLGLLGI